MPESSAVKASPSQDSEPTATPSAKKMIAEHGLDSAAISGSGRHGQILKEDVQAHLQGQQHNDQATGAAQAHAEFAEGDRPQKRVPMSRLRAKVAERLLEAQHNAAILTTFNEIDMQAVMDLRQRYRELFEKKHKVKLGFMSFSSRRQLRRCDVSRKSMPPSKARISCITVFTTSALRWVRRAAW